MGPEPASRTDAARDRDVAGAQPARTGAAHLAEAVRILRAAGVDDPAGDARRLLAHALGLAPGRLVLALPEPLAQDRAAAFAASVATRAARQPVSQITGQRAFWGRSFRVGRAVLDPRPETETLIAAALERPARRILDLGTGSGCILLSLLADWPEASGVGTDASADALEVAAENATALGVADRVRLIRTDWAAGIAGAFDLIVSNPPYIPAADLPGLAPEVRDWEPAMALSPGGDGLDAYRALLPQAAARLAPSGRLLLEHGPGQAAAIAALAAPSGLAPAGAWTDMDGKARVLGLTKMTGEMPG